MRGHVTDPFFTFHTVNAFERGEAALLAIIDARTMALVANATVPGAIPLGFHGSFRAAPPGAAA